MSRRFQLMGKFCLVLLLVSVVANAQNRSLLILHTNDFHGHISSEEDYAGAARIAAFFKQQRALRKDVLILDAGDSVSGTPVSTLFKGIPIFQITSAMGYDFGNLGNHEFDYGYRQIDKFKAIASYPLLGANSFAPDGKLLADSAYRIKDVNGIKIGIIGLLTHETPAIIIPTGNENLHFEKPEVALKRILPDISKQVDLVIVLSHVGYEEDLELARKFPDIDVIIGGHSHTLIPTPVKVNDTFVVQANRYGTHVGYIDLIFDTEKDIIVSIDGTLVASKNLFAIDAIVQNLVEGWEEKVKDQVNYKIADATRIIESEELKLFLERILAETAGTDLAFYNQGGIRDKIKPGPVTARDIWNVEPFGNTVVTVSISGKDLKAIFEKEEGRARPGLEDDRQYVFATNSFKAEHFRKALKDAVVVKDKGILVRDAIIDYIQKHGLP